MRRLVDVCGYQLKPSGLSIKTEFEATVLWMAECDNPELPFGQLGEEHPEFVLLRNIALMFKFLVTMDTLQTEMLKMRRELDDEDDNPSFELVLDHERPQAPRVSSDLGAPQLKVSLINTRTNNTVAVRVALLLDSWHHWMITGSLCDVWSNPTQVGIWLNSADTVDCACELRGWAPSRGGCHSRAVP